MVNRSGHARFVNQIFIFESPCSEGAQMVSQLRDVQTSRLLTFWTSECFQNGVAACPQIEKETLRSQEGTEACLSWPTIDGLFVSPQSICLSDMRIPTGCLKCTGGRCNLSVPGTPKWHGEPLLKIADILAAAFVCGRTQSARSYLCLRILLRAIDRDTQCAGLTPGWRVRG